MRYVLFGIGFGLVILVCISGLGSGNAASQSGQVERNADPIRAYFYPHTSRLHYDIFYNGKALDTTWGECCDHMWQPTSVRRVEMVCKYPDRTLQLDIGIAFNNRPQGEPFFDSLALAEREFVFAVDGRSVETHSAISTTETSPDGDNAFEFQFADFFEHAHTVDLIGYRCTGNNVDALISVDSLFETDTGYSVAAETSTMFLLKHNGETGESRVSLLDVAELPSRVVRDRERLSRNSGGTVDVTCPLDLWPCDQAEREAHITDAMRKTFGYYGDGEVFFPERKHGRTSGTTPQD